MVRLTELLFDTGVCSTGRLFDPSLALWARIDPVPPVACPPVRLMSDACARSLTVGGSVLPVARQTERELDVAMGIHRWT